MMMLEQIIKNEPHISNICPREDAFTDSALYAIIGRSVIGDYCCVSIETEMPNSCVEPQNAGKYVVCHVISFSAPKKATYSVLIARLRREEIFAENTHMDYPRNPSHKYYSRIPLDRLNRVIQITCEVSSALAAPTRIKQLIRDPCEVAAIREQERPQTSLNNRNVIII